MMDAKRSLYWTMLALLLSPAVARTEKHSQVQEVFKQAKTSFAKQDYDAAIAAYDKVLQLDPKHFASHIGRGHAYRMKHDCEQAIVDYGQAIRLLREDPRIYDERGFVGTLTDLDHALYFHRLLVVTYVSRAETYEEQHDHEQAIADLGKAISLEPRDGNLYLRRAAVHVTRKDFRRAIADCNCLVRLAPDRADSYVHRGKLYLQQMDHEHALVDLDEAIRLNPRHAAAHYYRGMVYSALMEYAGAITDYQEMVRLDPQDCQAYFALAYLFANCPKAELRDRQKALEYAHKACRVPERNEREEYEISEQSFALPIKVDAGRRDKIEKIRIFVSDDQGKSWRQYKEYSPSDDQLIFTAPHDGSYWFAVRTLTKDGDCSPSRLDELVPAMKVYVNSAGKAASQKSHKARDREVEQLRGTVEQLRKKIEQLESERNSK